MAAYGGQSQQRWGSNTINADEYIRDLQLTDQAGRTCHTGPARGRGMLVLAFVSADDGESGATLAALQKLADGYKESGKLTVWAIAVGEDDAAATALASGAGFTGSLLRDRDGYHAMVYGIAATPTVLLVNGAGIVQRKAVGHRPATLTDISARIAAFAGVETPVAL
jgi:peroxiredoxin